MITMLHPKFILLFFIRYTLRVLDYIVPKDRNLILFGFPKNRYFSNSKALFEYTITYSTTLIPMCFSNDKGLHRYVSTKFGKQYSLYLSSFRFLWYFLRAKTVVYQHGKMDLYSLISKWTPKKVVCLWHGTSIKKLGYVFEESKAKDPIFNPQIFDPLTIDLLPVASRIEAHTMKDVFRSRVKKIIVTGLPRNDKLILNATLDHSLMNWVSKELELSFIPSHVILYAPTYRNYESEPLWFKSDELDHLMKECEKHNAIFIFRLHINHPSQLEMVEKYDHFKILGSEELLDIQEMLSSVTLLITDYSGIFYDYLLLDRPMIFFPYDLQRYESEIGFLYPYHVFTTGKKGYNWSDIIDCITQYFNGDDSYRRDRKIITDLMQEQRQPIACRQILNEIKKITGVKENENNSNNS